MLPLNPTFPLVVEVMGRYSNHCDQGERIQALLKMTPSGPSSPNLRTMKRVCRRLEPEGVARLVEGYAAGVPVDQLAASFGVNRVTVMKHTQDHYLPHRTPRLDPDQVEDVIRLYSEGLSTATIGKQFRVDDGTIALALRKAGVALRPRRGWNY